VLILTGANSAVGLRSMPARYLFLDEVDGYPGDVEGEGDPILLAERRSATFQRRKILLVSTPKSKSLSRIQREFEASDQRRYFVPCRQCGEHQTLELANLRWSDPHPRPDRNLGCGRARSRARVSATSSRRWRKSSSSKVSPSGAILTGWCGTRGAREAAESGTIAKGKLTTGRQVWPATAFDSRRRHSGDSHGAVEGYSQARDDRQQARDDRQQAQHQLRQAGRGLVLPALVDDQEADDQEVRRAVSACHRRAGAAFVAPARKFGRSRTGTSPIVILSHRRAGAGRRGDQHHRRLIDRAPPKTAPA